MTGMWTIKTKEVHPTTKLEAGSFYSPSDHWASWPLNKIVARMGYQIESRKLSNLEDFAGDGNIDLIYYLGVLPEELRAEFGEEFVNFILGALAAALKLRQAGFDKRTSVLDPSCLPLLFEAMALGLVPKGSRKALYEALIANFNKELYSDTPGEERAAVLFYAILAEVLEPIFSEASGDELGVMIDTVFQANPSQVDAAKGGDQKIIGWIMGQIMRASPTKLDPQTVRAAILDKLSQA